MEDLRFDDFVSSSWFEKQKAQKPETDLVDIIASVKNTELKLPKSIEANLAKEIDDKNGDLDRS